ncbi:Aldehyde dehydrogenase [Abortiporus biennis]
MSQPATLPLFMETPVEDIPKIYDEFKKSFATGKTRPVDFRKQQLINLGYMLKENMERLCQALYKDLGRHPTESEAGDVGMAINEVAYVYGNIDKWAATENGTFVAKWSPMGPQVRKEPKGVVLIISPFNFPILLSCGHMVTALAAGNVVVLKPSELSPHTSALLAELVAQYFDPTVVTVINGGVPQATKLLELQWDHILYTGSNRVGKIVATAAAQYLTPVTLELGGKSPTFIDPSMDLKFAAHRIMWGKVANAGQICLSPDYVLVPRQIEQKFIDECIAVLQEFYPEGARTSESYCRIVTEQHTKRIQHLLADTKGDIVFGGEIDVEGKYVAPTLVKNVPKDDSLMSEELFAPILPIIAIDDIEEGIAFVNSRDHPLAIYVFSFDKKFQDKVFDNTRSGGAMVNEVVVHAAVDGVPFGGVGASGNGYLIGRYGFETFSHLRATLNSPPWFDKLWPRYPPYNEPNLRRIRLLGPRLPTKDALTNKSFGNRIRNWFLGLLFLG